MIDRTHRELTDDDIRQIADTYHVWRGQPGLNAYGDAPGFCKAATLEEIQANNNILTPGRYVGLPEREADDEPFEAKMARLTGELYEQFAESRRLEEAIRKNLEGLGFGEEG